MAINRFYNQSLPVYTSQFVEDKTPWEEMIGFEQMKLKRADAAQETAGKVDALTSSIQSGLRTEELTPMVRERYKKKLDDWSKTYADTGNMANVHAIRDLTKINAEFLADKDVSLISKDAADSELYKRMLLQKKMGEYDTNLDPVTAQLNQFKSGDAYESYMGFVDPVGYARQSYEILPVHQQAGTRFEEKLVMDKNNKPIPNEKGENQSVTTMVEWQTKMRDEKELKTATENVADEYLKNRGPELKALAVAMKKPVSEITKEDIVAYLSPYEKEYLESDYNENSSIVGTRAASGGSKSSINPAFISDFNGPAEAPAMSNVSFEAGPGALNLVEKILSTDGEKTWQEIASIPGYQFLNSLSETFGKNGLLGSTGQALNDPNSTGQSTDGRKADNIGNIGPLYKKENDELAALSLIKSAGLHQREDFPFKDLKEFMDTPSEQWTEKQKIFVAREVNKLVRDKSKQVVTPKIDPLDEETEKYLQEIYGVGVSESGILAADKQASALFLGATIIDPSGKIKKTTDEFTDEEKIDLVGKGSIFKINGSVSPGTSQFGNDLLSVTVGDAQLYLKFDNEYTRSRKLYNEALSYNLPNNYGVGNTFAVNDVQNWYNGINVSTKFDQQGYNPNAIYMQTRNNPKNQTVELLVYDKDPKKEDAEFTVHALSNPGKNPHPAAIQFIVADRYYQKLEEAATDPGTKTQFADYRYKMFEQYKELISQNNGQK